MKEHKCNLTETSKRSNEYRMVAEIFYYTYMTYNLNSLKGICEKIDIFSPNNEIETNTRAIFNDHISFARKHIFSKLYRGYYWPLTLNKVAKRRMIARALFVKYGLLFIFNGVLEKLLKEPKGGKYKGLCSHISTTISGVNNKELFSLNEKAYELVGKYRPKNTFAYYWGLNLEGNKKRIAVTCEIIHKLEKMSIRKIRKKYLTD